LKDSKDFFNNNLLFYKKDNSAFRILLYIEGVLPSRLRKLFEAKKKIDEKSIFKNIKSKKGKALVFTFGIVQRFFPLTSNNGSYSKYFLDITNKVFTDKPVEYAFLLKFIMQKIRETFVQGNSTHWNTMEGFMLLNYVNELKILKKPRGGNNMKEKESVLMEPGDAKEVQMQIEKFFEEFSDFFDDNAKKGAFLEGVLTQKLLNIQWQERRATPFRSHLKGLKMNEKQVKALLPEIQNKLEEYGKNYYRDIEEITSKYLLQSGSNWRITNDEINFYFVMGMNLANQFKKKQDAVEVIENE
jgi:CRISPR-associated protein Csh1